MFDICTEFVIAREQISTPECVRDIWRLDRVPGGGEIGETKCGEVKQGSSRQAKGIIISFFQAAFPVYGMRKGGADLSDNA